MTNADEYEIFLGNQNVLYKRQINGRIEATIFQEVEDGERSQYLALALYDNDTDRWIVLRLSTVRKIWAFLVSRKFDSARRMNWKEKKKVDKQEARRVR